jgi:hypothetical protein
VCRRSAETFSTTVLEAGNQSFMLSIGEGDEERTTGGEKVMMITRMRKTISCAIHMDVIVALVAKG